MRARMDLASSLTIMTRQMECIIRWATPVGARDESPVTPYSGLVDAVLKRLELLPRQTQVADPVTGAYSTIGLLGDVAAGELANPRGLASQRMQLWQCRLQLQVKELYVA